MRPSHEKGQGPLLVSPELSCSELARFQGRLSEKARCQYYIPSVPPTHDVGRDMFLGFKDIFAAFLELLEATLEPVKRSQCIHMF